MIHNMTLPLLTVFTLWFYAPLRADPDSTGRGLEISTGASTAVYQSVFSLQQSFAFETAVRGGLGGAWDWQIGIRLGFSPALPEVFARLLAAPEVDEWQPAVGIELGVTRRARFEEGELFLRETRAAMEGDISPFYIAVYAAPLALEFWEGWRLRILELQVGTHLGNIGRTTRAQIGLLSVGVTL